MNDKQSKEVIDALVNFVKRVSQGGAPPEEVQVLPEVARVLLESTTVTFPA